MGNIEQLVQDVGNMPVDFRVKLVTAIMNGLSAIQPEVESSWRQEARRRLAEYDSGKVDATPANRSFARIFANRTASGAIGTGSRAMYGAERNG